MCGSEENTNLTRKGKLLLLWHQRLGHASFRLVRWLSRQGYLYGGTVDQSSNILCDSCRIAKASKRPIEKLESLPGVLVKKIDYNSIKSGDLRPGDRVSMDQYSSTTRGRLLKETLTTAHLSKHTEFEKLNDGPDPALLSPIQNKIRYANQSKKHNSE